MPHSNSKKPDISAALSVSGESLITDIFLPKDKINGHAIFVRSPYDRKIHYREARLWNSHGYSFVIQSVRGKYGSTGKFLPFKNELIDGVDSLDKFQNEYWASKGIISYGASYAAYCAQELYFASHPKLIGAISMVAASGSWCYFRKPNVFLALTALKWAKENLESTMRLSEAGQAHINDVLKNYPHENYIDINDELFIRLLGERPTKQTILNAMRERDKWLHKFSENSLPILHVGGFLDGFIQDTWDASIDNFGSVRGINASVIIGPWGHDLKQKNNRGFSPIKFEWLLNWCDSICENGSPKAVKNRFIGFGEKGSALYENSVFKNVSTVKICVEKNILCPDGSVKILWPIPGKKIILFGKIFITALVDEVQTESVYAASLIAVDKGGKRALISNGCVAFEANNRKVEFSLRPVRTVVLEGWTLYLEFKKSTPEWVSVSDNLKNLDHGNLITVKYVKINWLACYDQ